MAKRYRRVVMWFRRDLRVEDNTALFEACRDAEQVVPLFVVDDAVLSRPDTGPARVIFQLDALRHLDHALGSIGGRLVVMRGANPETLLRLVTNWDADAVYYNREYEPKGLSRDAIVCRELDAIGKQAHSFKDLVIHEPGEIASQSGKPYTVFTAYKRVWLQMPVAKPVGLPDYVEVPVEIAGQPIPTPAQLGVATSQQFECGGAPAARDLLHRFVERHLADYALLRDFPAQNGTSFLSKHLHAGTLSSHRVFDSIRGRVGSETFVSELCWRDFYTQILYHFPHVESQSFKPAMGSLTWENGEAHFEAWMRGRTGYPIVDASMRQLNAEAWMHNRCRMIVASFLTKDLFIDWKWGERYFMNHLVDGDLAANNGGWQWSAGTGTDAQPYFRVFNPSTQGAKFDPSGDFVRRYVPELAGVPDRYIHKPWTMSPVLQHQSGCELGKHYPFPVVDHSVRRKLALEIYYNAQSRQ